MDIVVAAFVAGLAIGFLAGVCGVCSFIAALGLPVFRARPRSGGPGRQRTGPQGTRRSEG